MQNLTIYTAMAGQCGDQLRLPASIPDIPGCRLRFVCFTDQPIANPGPYEIRPFPWQHPASPRRTARWVKLNSHLAIPDADLTLWHDTVLQIRDLPRLLADLPQDSDFCAFHHPRRTTIADEVVACIRLRKDDPDLLLAQLAHYQSQDMSDEHLLGTACVFRRRTPQVIALNEAWWSELSRWSCRDQVSLPYVFWKHRFDRWNFIPGSRADNPYFHFTDHAIPKNPQGAARAILSLRKRAKKFKNTLRGLRHVKLPFDGPLHRSIDSMRVGFLIAGTEKSGTTSLESYLRQHPQLAFPSRTKELHFFDNDAHWKRNSPNYRQYHRHFDLSRTGALFAEATPRYTYNPDAIRRIRIYNPAMKLVVLFRNPIERAWSHWHMRIHRGTEQVPFSQAIRREAQRLRKALPWHEPIPAYVDRGFYSEQIRRIDRFFERRQVLFIKSEEFFADPQSQIRRILSFLDLQHAPIDTSRIVNAAQPSPLQMSPDDRAYLIDAYRWEIKQVESLLNWDCSDWLQSDPCDAPQQSAAPGTLGNPPLPALIPGALSRG